jgi:iron(III) transport system substrate-binding protein
MTRTVLTSVLALSLAAPLAASELNLYSARHYDTDERLYSDFTAATGIKINRIEGKADALMARMAAEGQNSPADVLLTVDTSRLERAKNAGVLQAVDNATLEASVPAEFQDTENQWFGFSSRARIIFYDKNDVANPPETYADLAKPEYKGMVCIRSGTNVYMQTILASIITHEGEDAATDWAAGVLQTLRATHKVVTPTSCVELYLVNAISL